MTGTDRLRAIAGAWDEWGLGGTLAEIADEIERERTEDCYRMGFDCGTVWRVASDMERHCLGHEGMEDSPVARWARELRDALGGEGHDLTDEDREAIAWVRERGGLDHVRVEWRSRVPHERYEARRQRLLGHIAECETALGRRNERIEELGHRVSDLTRENAELRRRAMPEDCEWPRYESGELVQIGAMFAEKGKITNVAASVELSDGWFAVHGFDGAIDKYSKGERVKRPSVPAADGEPLEVGQTVWDTNGDELVIGAIEDGGHTVTCRYADVGGSIPTHGMWSPSDLTHQRPVLDAEGNRIEPAMDVWWVCEGDERGTHAEKLHVESIGEDGLVTCDPFNGGTWVELEPSELYVHKPVLDADGVPIELGDDLYSVESGLKLHVSTIDRVNCKIATSEMFALDKWADPSMFTHTKPEPPDSWERIEEDAGCTAAKYNERRGTIFTTKQQVARDLVRRCRALAERERGE